MTCENCEHRTVKIKTEKVINWRGIEYVDVGHPFCTKKQKFISHRLKCPITGERAK